MSDNECWGIVWKCIRCGSKGEFPPEAQISSIVRELTGIEAPTPVGFEFGGEDNPCPVCSDIVESG
ncbi:MAG TPA: hypothetical protein EYN66_14655 [Myxococcales bacterium]|nr:hypothetical protein [Myxococcales bacterium]